MGDGDLREARLTCERRERSLVLRIAIAVHEHDRDRAEAVRVGCLEVGARALSVERQDDLAVCAHALVHLDDARVEHLRQHDLAREELRPVLVADAELVAEAARDHEHRRVALALEQRIGRDRRPHLHRLDPLRRDRISGRNPEQRANARDRGVAIVLGILREELVRDERAVRATRDDVGERAAAVDPELPAGRGVGHGMPSGKAEREVAGILPGAFATAASARVQLLTRP